MSAGANVSEKVNLITLLEKTSPAGIAALDEVSERFKKLYSVIHPGAHANVFYEAEKFHFMKIIKENTNIASCSKLSLYGCFMDVAVSGLSFDPSFKHLYLVPYNAKVGEKYEKRAQVQISGPGELLLRQLQGQIKYADNPVLVYDMDVFKFGNRNGKSFLEHEMTLPRKSTEIIACYMKIVRRDNSIDYKVITQDDMARFQKFSKDPNSKAWTSGLGGMWQAKCIKHAFKNYPKLRTGEFTNLASQVVDEEAETIDSTINGNENIDYGVNTKAKETVVEDFVNIKDDDFVENPNPENGPTVNVEDETF